MEALSAALAAVAAVRDCPAVRRLCLDCWRFSEEHGEAAGLSFAAMLLEGVKKYQEHERAVREFGKAPAEDRAG